MNLGEAASLPNHDWRLSRHYSTELLFDLLWLVVQAEAPAALAASEAALNPLLDSLLVRTLLLGPGRDLIRVQLEDGGVIALFSNSLEHFCDPLLFVLLGR